VVMLMQIIHIMVIVLLVRMQQKHVLYLVQLNVLMDTF